MTEMTLNDIRALAGLERKMETGEQPYVVPNDGGGRMAVVPVVMGELGLEHGQPASPTLVIAILKAQIAVCEGEIDRANTLENNDS